MKTNAARALDSLGIKYELREYDVDPADLRAETVAAKIGMPAEQVFKTLVASGDRNGVCLAVVPGNAQLDLKALARLSGDRKVDTVALKEVQPLTGYVRGGVTALACLGYGSVFLAAGLLFRNPIIPAAVVLLWESANPFLPAALKKISVIFYLQSMCPVVARPNDMPALAALLLSSAEATPAVWAAGGLVVVTMILLAVAARRARMLEINYSSD